MKPSKGRGAKTASVRDIDKRDPPWVKRLENPMVAIVLVALFFVIFFAPVFFSGQGFQSTDLAEASAHKAFVDESFNTSGSLLDRYPLWTPYIFSGLPSLGSLIAAPYLNLVSVTLSPISGVFKVIAYYFFLAVATFFFLRRLGVAPLTGVFGTLGFVFCTHVITWIMFGHNNKPSTLIFLPLTLLATDHLWERPRPQWIALLGLSVGTLLLCAHLQIAYYSLLAAGLYMVVSTIHDRDRRKNIRDLLVRWGSWVGGILLGFAVSAVVYLPVLEYSPFSTRGQGGSGLPMEHASGWSFHPWEMATFFVPSFLGFGGNSYWGWMPFTDFPQYMGILILFLAVFTLVRWPRERLHVYFLILAVTSLFLSFGKHLPVLYVPFFKLFPYFNVFRVPSMILVLVQFSVAVLAAKGLDRILRTTAGSERGKLVRTLWITTAGFGVILGLLGGMMAMGLMESMATTQLVQRAGSTVDPVRALEAAETMAAGILTRAARDLALGVVVLGAGVLLLWTRIKGALPRSAVLVGILGLALFDLWRVNVQPATYRPRNHGTAARTEVIEFLQQDTRPFRVLSFGPAPSNKLAGFRIQSIQGYHAASLQIYRDLTQDVPLGKMLAEGNFNLINILNTKYLITKDLLPSDKLTVVHQSTELVMQNNEALPRMWFVDRARVIPDPKEHLAALRDPVWNPRREALMFKDPGSLDLAPGGEARVTKYEPREIRARVTSPGTCLLMISEVFYPKGWKAWVDDKPVDIYRGNYVLRAVKIPKGSHELKLRFDPISFQAGAFVSLGAYGICGLLGLLGFIRRKQ